MYQLDSDDPKLINQTLHNMKNALDDPRLKGRLELELVVFGRGTTVFKKDQPFEADVLALQQAGVVLSARRLQRRARQLPGQSMRPQGHCQPQLCCGDYEGE